MIKKMMKSEELPYFMLYVICIIYKIIRSAHFIDVDFANTDAIDYNCVWIRAEKMWNVCYINMFCGGAPVF